jgi:hypothetical protein
MSLSLVLLIGGGLIIANGGIGLIFGRRFRRMGWEYCPETTAKRRSSCVRLSDDGHPTHVGYVQFTYKVGGQNYSGLCTKSFPTEQEASSFVDDFAVRDLAVQYKPGSPENVLLVTR